MATPFLGEIAIFGFGYAPRGWAFCQGQTLSIQQNQALFSLLGTTYGGNGVSTFALPDLRGRAPIHQGTGAGLPTSTLGQVAGAESHTLQTTEMPSHNHLAAASTAAVDAATPVANYWGKSISQIYASTATGMMAPNALNLNVGNQAHLNMQPYLVLNFCISLTGFFPSRN